MNVIEKIGLLIFIVALTILTLSLGLSEHTLSADTIEVDSEYQKQEILDKAAEQGVLNKTYSSNITFIADYKSVLYAAQSSLEEKAKAGIPEGVEEWNYKIGAWKISDFTYAAAKASASGIVPGRAGLFFWLTFGLGLLGGLVYILPKFNLIPGIKHDNIYHSSMTRGLKINPRSFFLGATIVGVLLYGIKEMNGDVFWPIVTAVVVGLIYYLVFYKQGQKNL